MQQKEDAVDERHGKSEAILSLLITTSGHFLPRDANVIDQNDVARGHDKERDDNAQNDEYQVLDEYNGRITLITTRVI